MLGGLADLVRLSFDELDDLQLAVERVLAEVDGQERIRLVFEWSDRKLCAYVGPLRERAIAMALERRDAPRAGLGLGRVLETVVDSVVVERVEGEGVVVCLEKHARHR